MARILYCGDHDHAEVEYNTCKRVFAKFMMKWNARLGLFASGVFWIEKKYYKISDFDTTYPEQNYVGRKEIKNPPIIISNH